MKVDLVSIIVVFISSIQSVRAQNVDLSLGLDALPPCASPCLSTAVSASSCQLTDFECVCSNAPLQSAIEICVMQSCTVKEGLTTKSVTSTLCGAPVRDRRGELKRINIIMATLSNLSIFARMASRLSHLNPSYGIGADDIFLVIATWLALSNAIIIDRGALLSGMGCDMWTLSFKDITNFVRWFYVLEILYFVELMFLKLSMLFFYYRIFPGIQARRVIWGTVAFNVAVGVAFFFTGIFQCQPVSHYWTYWDGVDTGGKCININALAWANAAISIAVDVWMLGIPLFEVAKLQMALKKKAAVSLMFIVGTFVTVVSMLRLRSLVSFATSTNPTWDQWDVTFWSTVEINVGIICACMPTFRVLLAHVLPKVFGSTVGLSRQLQTDDRVQIPFPDANANSSSRLRESHSVGESLGGHTDSGSSRWKDCDDEVELVRRDLKP